MEKVLYFHIGIRTPKLQKSYRFSNRSFIIVSKVRKIRIRESVRITGSLHKLFKDILNVQLRKDESLMQ